MIHFSAPMADALQHVADNLRVADCRELAALGREPFQALQESVARSTFCRVGSVEGEALGVFGVAPLDLLGGWGSPWLLGTEALPRHAKAFLQQSKGELAGLQKEFPRLLNHVDARNTLSLRWLRWLGFVIDPAIPFGLQGQPFHPVRLGDERHV